MVYSKEQKSKPLNGGLRQNAIQQFVFVILENSMCVMFKLLSKNLSNTQSKSSRLKEQYLTAKMRKPVHQSQQDLQQM